MNKDKRTARLVTFPTSLMAFAYPTVNPAPCLVDSNCSNGGVCSEAHPGWCDCPVNSYLDPTHLCEWSYFEAVGPTFIAVVTVLSLLGSLGALLFVSLAYYLRVVRRGRLSLFHCCLHPTPVAILGGTTAVVSLLFTAANVLFALEDVSGQRIVATVGSIALTECYLIVGYSWVLLYIGTKRLDDNIRRNRKLRILGGLLIGLGTAFLACNLAVAIARQYLADFANLGQTLSLLTAVVGGVVPIVIYTVMAILGYRWIGALQGGASERVSQSIRRMQRTTIVLIVIGPVVVFMTVVYAIIGTLPSQLFDVITLGNIWGQITDVVALYLYVSFYYLTIAPATRRQTGTATTTGTGSSSQPASGSTSSTVATSHS
jgi:hypothetical protein